MTDTERARDPGGLFSLVPPAGWSWDEEEEQGGLEVWREGGIGVLHVIGFASDDEEPDPAEELYAFLEENGIEIEEDDVEDVVLDGGGELAFCEYETEEDEDGDATFWLSGVATAPGALVFVTYICPAGEQEPERDLVRQALATLRVSAAD